MGSRRFVALGLLFAAAVFGGCENQSKSEPKATTATATVGAGDTATATSKNDTAPAGYGEASAKALLDDLDDRSKQEATTAKLAAMGTEVVPLLKGWMVERAQAIEKAPKQERWDLWLAHEAAMNACVKIGKECLPALEAAYGVTEDSARRLTTCAKIRKLGGTCPTS